MTLGPAQACHLALPAESDKEYGGGDLRNGMTDPAGELELAEAATPVELPPPELRDTNGAHWAELEGAGERQAAAAV